jgi:hypothetical protein
MSSNTKYIKRGKWQYCSFHCWGVRTDVSDLPNCQSCRSALTAYLFRGLLNALSSKALLARVRSKFQSQVFSSIKNLLTCCVYNIKTGDAKNTDGKRGSTRGH